MENVNFYPIFLFFNCNDEARVNWEARAFNFVRCRNFCWLETIILIRSNKSLKLRGKCKFLPDFYFFSIATMNSGKQERSILFVAAIFVGSKRYVPLTSIESIILHSNKSLKLWNVENVNFYPIFLFFNCNDEHWEARAFNFVRCRNFCWLERYVNIDRIDHFTFQ